MIGYPTTFTASVQSSHNFGPSSLNKIYTATLRPFIVALCIRQKSIFELCGSVVHKDDSCIICGLKFLPTILRRNTNQFNALHGDKTTDTPREWSSQPTSDHFKYSTSPTKTSPLVLYIMVRLNHHAIDNCGVQVHTSDFLVEPDSESVPDPNTTPIKSIDDDEMDHLL